jgi:hypothetical protein
MANNIATLPPISVTCTPEWIRAVKVWTNSMIVDEDWVYSDSNNKISYIAARDGDVKTTNGALMVTHALQYAGIFSTSMSIYGHEDGHIGDTGGALEKLRKVAIITSYEKDKLYAKDADLRIGDIVCYYGGHTNIYRGKNSKGVMQWYDAGAENTADKSAGSTWNSFLLSSDDMKLPISNIIRFNWRCFR